MAFASFQPTANCGFWSLSAIASGVALSFTFLATSLWLFSNVYTSSYNERRPVSNAQFDKAIYQNLMTSALQQAAEELYELCKPGEDNKIRPTPLPENN